ncbi:maltokinase N-terminal cap-like domain-containing protein [Schumannella soli]|uniref:Maltokinase n=1 Tax=Schumannella soli TaxID=2590779 RepID=A0A506Y3Q4_9MICO|nr:aminoglycoside phosphotransferase [Schumannella soli]TPW76057.1 aminoglycoside phosphotransferase [Schumannella soli]
MTDAPFPELDPHGWAALAAWMREQRWFAAKGSTPRLRQVARLDLTPCDDGARPVTLLVADDADSRRPVYQLALVARPAGGAEGGDPIVLLPGGVLNDGARDPAYAEAVLAELAAAGAELGDAPRAAAVPFAGEQSNTSLVIAREGDRDLVIKLFRVVHHGENPEIELQRALTRTGSPVVPRFIGSLAATWSADGAAEARGDLAVVQEFIGGAVDGWALASRAAAGGHDFRDEARQLGAVTAAAHLGLAQQLGHVASSPTDVSGLTGVWEQRLEAALTVAPQLAVHAEEIRGRYAAAAAAPWGELQRIHGDLHLGQALHAPDGRWLLIDFEGEPLRTLAERTHPEPVLRDVAGMLRSFDYAGSAHGAAGTRWAEQSAAAYLEGYSAASGATPGPPELLLALQLDKAVYEVTYEVRNRPDWVGIPLGAIQRMLRSS